MYTACNQVHRVQVDADQLPAYENGVSALLLHLSGTVPVAFRGTQYRFPVAIWIPYAYPYESPIVYVMPTEDMVIRPGQHVSPSDGKIYHPYLANWREASDVGLRRPLEDYPLTVVEV